MYRKVEEQLTSWKASKKKKALLITGARQIGKTYIIRAFGKKNYKSFVELNFITQPDAKKIFSGNLDAETIIMNLSAFTNEELIPGETLIFLDEIQECPNARTAIKFLVEDGSYDYIESGSLLGVNYKAVPSYPVGFEECIQMYPMDFEEFCIANNIKKELLDYLKDCYQKRIPPTDLIHEKMINMFKYYIIVGGMPDVVKTFIEHKDIKQVIAVQNDILNLYRQDISKYTSKEKVKVTNIFDRIPSELDQKNRRFNLASIDRNARLREYEDSFVWLSDAGVALPCYNLNELRAPLKISEQRRLFKLFMCDTGLLCAMCLENIQFEILQGNLSVNMGGILENVFAQQLKSNGFSLRYYNRQKNGEIDFVVQKGSDVLPIEIKSGKTYKMHSALNNILEIEEWDLKKGFVFCQGNYESVEKIHYIPWYMIMFLKVEEQEYSNIQLDISI